MQSPNKGHNVVTLFKCTYVRTCIFSSVCICTVCLQVSCPVLYIHTYPPPPPTHPHSLLFHISSPAVSIAGAGNTQISCVAASEMLHHTCRDISRRVWQPLTLSFAIVPSAIATKTLLPRLVMSRMESFMAHDHTSHCDWWLKDRSWKSRVPTRTSLEGLW